MPAILIQEFLSEPAVSPEAVPDVMIAEAHHRIANNLSLIASLTRLQARELAGSERAFDPVEVQLVLAEVGARLETVARLHRLLSATGHGDTLDLGGYLGEVAVSVISSLEGHTATPRFSAELRGGAINRCQALRIGLIVGELVTNSLKYAHPAGVAGEIRLVCCPSARGTLVEISDDGVGFPEDFDPENSGGLGFRIVRALAAGLNAKIEFEQTGLGLTCRIDIPRGLPVRQVDKA